MLSFDELWERLNREDESIEIEARTGSEIGGSVLETVSAILHETRYAETKGTGIRAIREAMDRHDLAPPFFESDREKDTFTATFLFHHLLSAEDLDWLDCFRSLQLSAEEQKALVFVREVGAINNAAYRDINRVETLAASGHLRRLRDLGLLEQRGQGRATYYVPAAGLLAGAGAECTEPAGVSPGRGPANVPSSEPNVPSSDPNVPSSESDVPSSCDAGGVPARRGPLPPEVLAAVQALGARPPAGRVRQLLLHVSETGFWRAEELGCLFRRDPLHLQKRYLSSLVTQGLMEYAFPDEPTHPLQAYRTVVQPDVRGGPGTRKDAGPGRQGGRDD